MWTEIIQGPIRASVKMAVNVNSSLAMSVSG